MEGVRGPCDLEKEWTGLTWNEMWREPEDRVAWRKNGRAELELDMDGARGQRGLEKQWTGLSWNEMWREPEDHVAWRKNGQG